MAIITEIIFSRQLLMADKRPYLEALGIPLWLPRSNHPSVARSSTLAQEENREDAASPESAFPSGEGVWEGTPEPGLPPSQSSSLSPPSPDLPSSEEKAFNVDDWRPPLMDDDWEPVFEVDAADLPDAPPLVSREARIARMDWEELAAEARQCTACELCTTRTQAVFGVGDRRAEWLVIGEAPGADEDRQGEPFVGRAGKLLNPMLLAIGLKREQVYIANILKCRPPENREPTPAEALQCRPFLERQIELIRPRIILAVGRIAAQNLLETNTPIGKLRGRVHRFGAARLRVVVTYHPAYLLRSPREKRKAWDDLRLARRTLANEAPDPAWRPADSCAHGRKSRHRNHRASANSAKCASPTCAKSSQLKSGPMTFAGPRPFSVTASRRIITAACWKFRIVSYKPTE